MSTNGFSPADAQAQRGTPAPPEGFTKWFDVEFKDVPADPSVAQKKEAIEGYYVGYTAGCNVSKGSSYAIRFGWSEVASVLPDCIDYTLHVFVDPPPVIVNSSSRSFAASANVALNDDDGDEIDPPTPPKPPPPTM